MSPSGSLNTTWRKSSFSESLNCVEARRFGDFIQVRNSRDRRGPVLSFTFDEWRAFLRGVAAGQLGLSDYETVSKR